MILEEAYNLLISDAASSDPGIVQARNPNLWPTVGEVPPYAFEPLTNIWTAGALSSSVLATRVVWQQGIGYEAAQGDITLEGQGEESVLARSGTQDNTDGAETMLLNVVFRMPESEQNLSTIINAELRVRHILDARWRAKRGLGQWHLSSTPYLTGYIRFQWRRWLTYPNADECAVEYIVSYDTAVPR